MELKYHTCGYPIRVWAACLRRDGEPTFFDGRSCWTERAIRTCPGCGERLSRAVLRDKAPAPAGTLAAYMLAWPYVRRQLEGLIKQRAQLDATFRAEHAEAEILELDGALNRVAELAARLEEPVSLIKEIEAEYDCTPA